MKKKILVIVLFLLFILSIFLIWQEISKFSFKTNFSLPSPQNQLGKTSFLVEKVYDGDTIKLSDNSIIRYIGIDSPEINSKNSKCFAEEAKIANEELVLHQEIFLEKDISETDKYNRLLRYVYIKNPENKEAKIMINKILVEKGFAKVATYPPDVKYQQEFLIAQKQAQENNLGLWNECAN